MTTAGIQVEGLREFRRALGLAGKEAPKALQRHHKTIATRIARDAAARAPRRSGALARDIRPYATQRDARVVGGQKVVYFGVQEFGGSVPSPGNAGIGRIRRKRDHDDLAAGRRIRIKPYRGPVGRRRPWWDSPDGYFLFPAGRAHRQQIIAEYIDALDEIVQIAFPG